MTYYPPENSTLLCQFRMSSGREIHFRLSVSTYGDGHALEVVSVALNGREYVVRVPIIAFDELRAAIDAVEAAGRNMDR